MTDVPPDRPWIDPPPGMPPPAPPQADRLPPPAPRAPQGGGPTPVNPLAEVERLTTTSLILSVVSLFCCGFLAIVALVYANKAQTQAKAFGTTSVDGRVRTAKVVSIVAIAIWAAFFVIYVLAALSKTNT
jgi:hypothetical protein